MTNNKKYDIFALEKLEFLTHFYLGGEIHEKVLAILILAVTLKGVFCLASFAATTRITNWWYNNTSELGTVTIGSNRVITVDPTERDGIYGAFQVDLPANTAYQNKKITLYVTTRNSSGLSTATNTAVLYDNQLGWPLAGDLGILNMPIRQAKGATYDAKPSFTMSLSNTNTTATFKTVSTGLNKGWYQFTVNITTS